MNKLYCNIFEDITHFKLLKNNVLYYYDKHFKLKKGRTEVPKFYTEIVQYE